jgi:hypothetical protein
MELYLHSPICLHGMQRDIFTFVGWYIDGIMRRFMICSSHQVVGE